jgi:hypothetical protein
MAAALLLLLLVPERLRFGTTSRASALAQSIAQA